MNVFKKINNKKYFLLFIFLVSIFLQSIKLNIGRILDQNMWANQAKYFQINDEKQYDFLQAYAHPGGSVIEGTIILHKLFNISYENSVYYLLIFLNSSIIFFICLFIFLCKKNDYFTITTFLVLSFHRFYYELTPTSYIASLLFVLQAFYSLFLYQNREKLKLKDILGFSVLAGLIMATRIDIGFIGTLFFGIYLLPKISMRDFIYSVLLMLGSFVLFDPYMWYMPFQHISDLAYKFIYHYEFFGNARLDLLHILSISVIVTISILIFLFLYFFYRKKISINIRFLFFVLFNTIFSYYIFMTSQINAIRYFMPFILLWEILFSILILDLLEYGKNKIPTLFKERDSLNLKVLLILIMLFINFLVPFI